MTVICSIAGKPCDLRTIGSISLTNDTIVKLCNSVRQRAEAANRA